MYAMKVLRKSHLLRRRQIERTKTERRVLGRLDHVFIMKLHYAFQSQEKVREWARMGENVLPL